MMSCTALSLLSPNRRVSLWYSCVDKQLLALRKILSSRVNNLYSAGARHRRIDLSVFTFHVYWQFRELHECIFWRRKERARERLQDHFAISAECFFLVGDALQLVDLHVYCLEGGRTASLGKQVNRVFKWKALNWFIVLTLFATAADSRRLAQMHDLLCWNLHHYHLPRSSGIVFLPCSFPIFR